MAGDTTGSDLSSPRATQLLLAINTRLVRADGIYIDGLDADGSRAAMPPRRPMPWRLPTASCRPDRVAAIGRYVASLGISVGPAHGLELLRGLAAAGLPDAIVKILTDASRPGWAHILAAGGTFTWETWTPSDLIGDSMSHGWGSSALVAMKESLLGHHATGSQSGRDGAGRHRSSGWWPGLSQRLRPDRRRTPLSRLAVVEDARSHWRRSSLPMPQPVSR